MKPIFYDSDVLSCFLVIHDVSILKQLFNQVIISNHVFNELKRAKFFSSDVLNLVDENFIEVCDYDADIEMKEFIDDLANAKLLSRKIGLGEASAIALAVKHNGILATNNTRDIAEAIKKFNIKRIKTGDIFVKAYNECLISEEHANELWAKMISKNRYLTEDTFSVYLNKNPRHFLINSMIRIFRT